MKILLHLILLLTLSAQAQRPNNNPNNYPSPPPCRTCPQAMSSVDFDQAMTYIKKESFDDNKMLVAKRVVDGNYPLASQVKEMVKQFSFSSNQLEFAKYAYAKTYDQKNYYMVSDAFSFSSNKRDLNEWLATQPINDYSRNQYFNHPVAMSNEEFNLALQQIKKESFDDNKMLVAKRVVDGNYPLSAQVKEMTKQFSFSSNQLEFAKYAYAKTYDQKNYYVVNDAFSFSSNKRDLSNWLSGQPINNYEDNYNHHHHNGNHHNPGNNNGWNDNNHNGNNNGWNNNPNGNNNNNGGYNNNNNNGLNNNPNGNNNNNPNNNNGGLNNNNNNGSNGNPNNNISNTDRNGSNNGGTNNNTNNGGLNNNPNGNNNMPPAAMPENDFLNVKAQFNTKPSDRIKVQYAEHVSTQNYWSVQQVAELMQLLTFEDERLNLAKSTYPKTVDNQNYNAIFNLLTDINHKQALNQFIAEQQNNNNGEGIRR